MSSIDVDGVDQLVDGLEQIAAQLRSVDPAVHAEAADQVLGYMHPTGAFKHKDLTPLGYTIGIGGPYFPGREAFLERPLTAAEQDVADVYLAHLEQLLNIL